MAKLKGPLALLALGALGFGALSLAKPKGDVVTGKSGKSWRVVMLGNASGVKTYEVFAPASSFGPHGELSVLRYTQTGSEVASRKIVGVGAGVPVSIVQTAASDFSLPFDPSKMPG
ncbi:MAG TPA: hypothetical protein VGK73_04075 [Polyangiaceae bacterium]